MVPWDRLPKDLQQAILLMIVMFGGTATACRLGPLVCDPPPPPTHTPMICDPPPPPLTRTPPATRSSGHATGASIKWVQFDVKTPMICDPPPPPLRTRRAATPTAPVVCDPAPPPSQTPMICDPPPPPPPEETAGPRATLAPGQHFSATVSLRVVNPALPGGAVVGKMVGPDGLAVSSLPLVLRCGTVEEHVLSDAAGAYALPVPGPGVCRLAVEGDEANALALTLQDREVVVVDWVERWTQAAAPLPLAEIRAVHIVLLEGFTFAAETQWPGARYRWMASGGTLAVDGERATWQPPTEPGRCLLQVAADWGRAGLAVSAIGLEVDEDGGVTILP
jgi:hypothetical protein